MLLLGVVAVATVCLSASEHIAPRIRNAILILVDTLRADHLELYGYERHTSPNLTAVSRSAVVFERARNQAPCTFPSVDSLLTSRHPVWFTGQEANRMGIPEQVPSIAEILGAHGVTSHAVSASAIVRATPSRFNPDAGFGRGFATFDERCLDQAADCVNGRAFPRLPTSESAPSFLYLHYIDPHGPYRPPVKYRRRFAKRGHPDALITRADPVEIEPLLVLPQGTGAKALPPGAVQHLIDLYDDEIGFWDLQLSRLFRRLEASGALADTIVVLAADHGEGFLEHGTMVHCRSLYDNEIRTPLVMWIPGVRGRRIAPPVENLDIVPTVLDYLGIPANGLEGVSLRPLIESRSAPARRLAHSFHVNLRSVNDHRHKRVLDVVTGDEKVFDLEADPGETVDLAVRDGSGQDVAPDLAADLRRWIERNEGPDGASRSAEQAGGAIERLRALGYIH